MEVARKRVLSGDGAGASNRRFWGGQQRGIARCERKGLSAGCGGRRVGRCFCALLVAGCWLLGCWVAGLLGCWLRFVRASCFRFAHAETMLAPRRLGVLPPRHRRPSVSGLDGRKSRASGQQAARNAGGPNLVGGSHAKSALAAAGSPWSQTPIRLDANRRPGGWDKYGGPFFVRCLASSGHRGRDDARGRRDHWAACLTRTTGQAASVACRDERCALRAAQRGRLRSTELPAEEIRAACIVEHEKERWRLEVLFASSTLPRGGAGRGHRRGLDGPTMPQPLKKTGEPCLSQPPGRSLASRRMGV